MELEIETSSAYSLSNVSVRLPYQQDTYKVHNDKGHPFYVRSVSYSGGDKVSVNGTAILVDGTTGVNSRYASVPLAEVPPVIVAALLRESWALIPGNRG